MDLPRLSPSAQSLIKVAAAQSTRRGHYFLGVGHLFVALARTGGSRLSRALSDQQLDVYRFCDELVESVPVLERRPWGTEMLLTPRNTGRSR